MSKGNPLVSLLCEEFVNELFSQPSVAKRGRISRAQIDSAADVLCWNKTCFSANRSNGAFFSKPDLEALASNPVVVDGRSPQDSAFHLEVFVQGSSHWKSSTTFAPPSTSLARTELPEGVREFISQVESTYAGATGGLEEAEILESVRSSQYLSIAFPHLVRFAVNEVRCRYKQLDSAEALLRILRLLESMISNPMFKSFDVFEILLSSLVCLASDFNLMTIPVRSTHAAENWAVRTEASRILCLLIATKVGNFHSVELVRGLCDSVFFPIISGILTKRSIKGSDIFSNLLSALAGCIHAVVAMVGMNLPKLKSEELVEVLKKAKRFIQEVKSDSHFDDISGELLVCIDSVLAI